MREFERFIALIGWCFTFTFCRRRFAEQKRKKHKEATLVAQQAKLSEQAAKQVKLQRLQQESRQRARAPPPEEAKAKLQASRMRAPGESPQGEIRCFAFRSVICARESENSIAYRYRRVVKMRSCLDKFYYTFRRFVGICCN